MRIAFIAPFGRGKKTTVPARIVPLGRELQALGHSVQVIVPPWDTPQDAGKRVLLDTVELNHVELVGGVVPTVRRMLGALADYRPDLVHIVKPRAHAGLVQWWLWQRRAGRPPILLDVDDWEQPWAAINHYPRHVSAFLAWQEEWGIRHAHAVTAASRWLVERVTTVAPQIPTLYLPNGVTVPPSAPLPADAPTRRGVLWFTRFIEMPPAWIAAFWAALARAVPDATLLIAGAAFQPEQEEPYRAALAHYLALPPGAPGHATWVGYVASAELEQLYRAAGCAIFPAPPTPLHQAKCSVRLATTLLHGVPVVASAVGEQAAYGADGAATLLPPDASPTDFAAAVAAVLRAPVTPATAPGRAHLLAKYQWRDLAARLDAFYDTLIT